MARIEQRSDRSRHLTLCRIAGINPHVLQDALDRQDAHDSTQAAIENVPLPF